MTLPVFGVRLVMAVGELADSRLTRFGVSNDASLVGDGETRVYPRPSLHAVLALLCVPTMTLARAVRLLVDVRTPFAESNTTPRVNYDVPVRAKTMFARRVIVIVIMVVIVIGGAGAEHLVMAPLHIRVHAVSAITALAVKALRGTFATRAESFVLVLLVLLVGEDDGGRHGRCV